ncbi:MAG: D-alanine--D-alanine ligase family protein [Elusimicrobiota bacterium]
MAVSDIGKVGILTGGDSFERDISLETAKSVEQAVKALNLDYVVIHAEGSLTKKIKDSGVDIVFIAMHGGLGENGSIQGFLDILDIPYTGSGVLASAVCMNKKYSKMIFEHGGIKTPKWQIVNSPEDRSIDLPAVIKPVEGGSTVATTIVHNSHEIETAFSKIKELYSNQNLDTNNKVLIEEYIPGKEITVGILEDKALPILEIKPKKEFYDYEAKYKPGMSSHFPLENIDRRFYSEIQKTAEIAFKTVGCRDMGRVDFRLNNSDLYILEINTIPGMTKTSLLPEAAALEGIDFNSLIYKILTSAKKKVYST